MMMVRALLFLGFPSLLLMACGSEPDVAAPPPAAAKQAIVSLEGTYRVTGFTVEKESGSQREIAGTVILRQDGDRYISTFNLTTLFPTPDGPLKSDVIGRGEGTIEGRSLRGSAITQIIMAQVPGVDAKFAFIPRFVGPRLVSSTVARLGEDGLLTVEIESEPSEGQTYAATRTTVSGTRIAPAPAPKSGAKP
ncbi:MAG: hypothetical protein IH800_11525 [Myxococcales bacterium]|nr:hypothetical protein [Myxococcales bacterium]MCZ6712535.1 hypothetical protein [Deltaproteobacteria bacterium]MCZ6823999.1 hypothetical protein [Deltaproteobacteria bacterium]